MTSKRLIAVGDIHGCLNELKLLMDKIRPTEDDKFIFLGDYIDRGPNVRGVLDYLIEFKSKFPETIFLCGNHEDMFTQYLDNGIYNLTYIFMRNGGGKTIEQFRPDIREFFSKGKYYEFLNMLRPYYETGSHFFVHAGVLPHVSLQEQLNLPAYERDQNFMWIRDEFLCATEMDWGKIIVHGHTRTPKIVETDNRINLDTGCVYSGKLSAMDVITRVSWSVSL